MMAEALRTAEFVGFGGDNGEGDIEMPEIVDHLHIILCRFMAQIDQLQHMAQFLRTGKILFHHAPPITLDIGRHFGKTVSGQIHQMECAAVKDIDDARFARLLRSACKFEIIAHAVDEGAFADIALAGDGDLG